MSFVLTVLGTSSALPTTNRFPTAHVLNVHERFFLIDCGEGTQVQLRKYHIRFQRINHIFISHLHGDHCFGLLGLISTLNLLGRENDLHIYCHPDLETVLKCQLDITYRNELAFKLKYHFLNYDESELIFDDEMVSVYSFPLKHRVPTCGFLFREKQRPQNIRRDMIDFYQIPVKDIIAIKAGADWVTPEGELVKNERLTLPPPRPRSYAFCSDTTYKEDIIPIIKNVDLLYHEATYSEYEAEMARMTVHSTTIQAATIAKKAEVKQLIIGHFSARYKKTDSLLAEAKTVFADTIAVNDGDKFEIK